VLFAINGTMAKQALANTINMAPTAFWFFSTLRI
jgi:hypothetical protein